MHVDYWSASRSSKGWASKLTKMTLIARTLKYLTILMSCFMHRVNWEKCMFFITELVYLLFYFFCIADRASYIIVLAIIFLSM